MLEGIESSTNPDDIEAYKTNTRKVFEQLLIKLEENSDHIYSLEHRVKFLEQECEDKDLDIENVTSSMQDAVNDCRQEAEEMVGELMGKVSAEVKQRHEVEGLVRRLQTENSKMKVCSSSFMFQFYRWSYDGVI
jgi:chromosome segregation ATPase